MTSAHPGSLCYTRSTFTADWTEVPLLELLSASDQLAPAHATAELRYRFGPARLPARGSRPADSSATNIPRPDLLGQYVRAVFGSVEWFGLIVAEREQPHDTDAAAAGILHYSAVGLTFPLQSNAPVLSTVTSNNGDPVTVYRALPFNGGTLFDSAGPEQHSLRANKSPGEALFAGPDAEPEYWQAADAVDYLLEHHAPRNLAGAQLLPYRLAANSRELLRYPLGKLETDNRSVWDLLSAIIDRRRGLVWSAVVQSDAVEITVRSGFAAPVNLSRTTIAANSNIATIDTSTLGQLLECSVTTTTTNRADIVIVEGEPLGAVVTLRAGVQLVKSWTTEQQTTYNTAATGQTGFGALDDPDKAAVNADRRAEDDLLPVFSSWHLSGDWDGLGYDLTTETAEGIAFPSVDAWGEIDTETSATQWVDVLRVADYVPVYPDAEYTGELPELIFSPGALDYVGPSVWFLVDDINTGASPEWIRAERLNAAADSGSDHRPFEYSVDVRTRADVPGLDLITVGAPQHYIASDLYSSNGGYEDIAAAEGIAHDAYVATVYMMRPQRLRAVYPPEGTAESGDVVRARLIRIPGLHLDYLTPGTTVRIDTDGVPVVADVGGYVRDDRERAADLARLAFEWYGADRSQLTLSARQLTSPVIVGDYVASILHQGRSVQVNAIVSRVRFDVRNATLSIQTNFAEFDLQTVAGLN